MLTQYRQGSEKADMSLTGRRQLLGGDLSHTPVADSSTMIPVATRQGQSSLVPNGAHPPRELSINRQSAWTSCPKQLNVLCTPIYTPFSCPFFAFSDPRNFITRLRSLAQDVHPPAHHFQGWNLRGRRE